MSHNFLRGKVFSVLFLLSMELFLRFFGLVLVQRFTIVKVRQQSHCIVEFGVLENLLLCVLLPVLDGKLYHEILWR